MRGGKTNKKNDLSGKKTLLHCNCTAWFDNIMYLAFVVLGWQLAPFLSQMPVGVLSFLSLSLIFHLLLSTLLPRSFDSVQGLCLMWRRGNGGINHLDTYNLYNLSDLTKCVSSDPFPGGSLCVCVWRVRVQRFDEVSQPPLSFFPFLPFSH